MTIETKSTKFGTVFRSSTCKDDFDNLVTYDQPPLGGATVTLQHPAIRAFKEAENRYGAKRHWRPGRPKRMRRRNGTWFRPINLTGSIRSCALQRQLFATDSSRFANPNVTLHTQGLAIDVNTNFLNGTVKALLLNQGWTQTRPDDEPWHFSFGWTA